MIQNENQTYCSFRRRYLVGRQRPAGWRALIRASVVCSIFITRNMEAATRDLSEGQRSSRVSVTVDYHMGKHQGEIVHPRAHNGRLQHSGLAGGEVVWKNVTHADADGVTSHSQRRRSAISWKGFAIKMILLAL